MSTQSDKLIADTARESIATSNPLFTKMLFDTPFEVDYNIPTLCTNGKVVKYNPDFMRDRTKNDQVFMFLHELGHQFLAHHLRIDTKNDPDDEQLAADYAVNALLKETKLKMPRDAHYKYKYHNMAKEEIYRLIHQDDDEQFDKDNKGVVEPSPDLDEEDQNEGCADQCSDQLQGSQKDAKRDKLIAEHEQKTQQDIQAGLMAGTLSSDLEQYLKGLLKPENNWQDILANLMVRTLGKDDFTFSAPNRRYEGVIVPSLYSERLGTIAVVIDTSGSVTAKMRDRMASDIVGLADDMCPEKLIVMGCNTAVTSYEEFSEGDEINLNIKHGGGTDFRPPFERLKREEEIETLIYLTDGYCTSYPPEPDYPVIWVIWQDNTEIKPPFGEVVVMEGRK